MGHTNRGLSPRRPVFMSRMKPRINDDITLDVTLVTLSSLRYACYDTLSFYSTYVTQTMMSFLTLTK